MNGDLRASAASASNKGTKIPKPNRPRLERKAAIHLRQNEIVNQAVFENFMSIANPLKQWTELVAEKNAMMAFNSDECEKKEDLRDHTEFLRLIQNKQMRCMREEKDDGAGLENGSDNDDDSDKSEYPYVSTSLSSHIKNTAQVQSEIILQ